MVLSLSVLCVYPWPEMVTHRLAAMLPRFPEMAFSSTANHVPSFLRGAEMQIKSKGYK